MSKVIVKVQDELYPVEIMSIDEIGERLSWAYISKDTYDIKMLLELVRAGVLRKVSTETHKYYACIDTHKISVIED